MLPRAPKARCPMSGSACISCMRSHRQWHSMVCMGQGVKCARRRAHVRIQGASDMHLPISFPEYRNIKPGYEQHRSFLAHLCLDCSAGAPSSLLIASVREGRSGGSPSAKSMTRDSQPIFAAAYGVASNPTPHRTFRELNSV